MLDSINDMTVKKSCKFGKYEPFEHLLSLFALDFSNKLELYVLCLPSIGFVLPIVSGTCHILILSLFRRL